MKIRSFAATRTRVACAAGLLSVFAIVLVPAVAQDAAAPAAPAAAPAAPAAAPAAAPGLLVGDPEAGAAKAAVCGACHGVNGNSVNPEWPNLAGQHPQYTKEQLVLFKGTVRANPVMQAQAMPLTPQDMADLAEYFARQTPAGLEADPSLVDTGEKLYRAGDPARGIPSCKSCHGPAGIGNGPAKWPQVRAQHSVYTYGQLKAYANRTRYTAVQGQPSPPLQAEMMYEIASRLTDEEMRALASYLQGLR